MSSSDGEDAQLPDELVEALPCRFVILDGDGDFFDANLAWESQADGGPLPSAPEEGRYLDALRRADDQRLRSLADRIDTLLGESTTTVLDDPELPLRLVSFPQGDRQYVGLLDTSTDERSRPSAELRLKERTMDEAPVGITITNPHLPDNPVVYANAAFERITGYPIEEVVGRNCRFLQGENTDEETVRRIREAVDAGEPVTVDVCNYRRCGEEFWNEVTIAPLRNDAGEITHFVGFQKDATDRKRAEEELATERDRLAVLNQIVRHDIRNDMAVALGWGEQLREHVDPEGEEALEHVLNAATHTKELTSSVRDLARILDADDPSLTAVPLAETLEAEADRVRSSFDYRSESVTITVETVPADLHVRGSSLLSSVFGNLLENAVFHNDEAEIRIDVAVEERRETAVVRIADNGSGIDDRRKREVFGRGEKGLESPGSGLGLYLVDQLVETFGGSVWIEDNEPEGTVFCVELPKAERGVE